MNLGMALCDFNSVQGDGEKNEVERMNEEKHVDVESYKRTK